MASHFPSGSAQPMHVAAESYTQRHPASVVPKPNESWTTVPNGERILIDNTGAPIKRKRPQSCDTCRQRKIKCVRLYIEGLETSHDQRCVQCRAIDAKCTYTYIPRRPGPQTSAAKALQREQERATKHARLHARGKAPSSSHASSSRSKPSPTRSGTGPRSATSSTTPQSVDMDNAQMTPGNSGAEASTAGSSIMGLPRGIHNSDALAPPLTSSSIDDAPMFWAGLDDASMAALPNPVGQTPFGAATGNTTIPTAPRQQTQQASGLQPPPPSFGIVRPRGTSSATAASVGRAPRGLQLSKTFAAPIERPRSLADIAPRQTFLSVIAIYFQHLYPLMPMVHRPTFSHDLLTCRDAHDEAFLALVLSLTAYTLVQAPRSVIPAPWSFYRRLHKICHLTSRRLQPRRYDPPRLVHLCTLYCDHIYLGSTGWNNAANATLGEAIRTAFTLGIHDERRQPSSGKLNVDVPAPDPARRDAIQTQLRRRLYYLIYGSDKTIAVLQEEPISLRDDDTWGVEIPVAVDDDCLTRYGVRAQPPERGPSILCGFVTVTKLHVLLSEVVEAMRADRRRPPPDFQATLLRIQSAANMAQRIRDILDEMPEPLRAPPQTSWPPPRKLSIANLPGLGVAPPPEQGPDGRQASSSTVGGSVGAGQRAEAAGGAGASPGTFELPFLPWPVGTFDANGLPSQENASQPSSSAHASPTSFQTMVGGGGPQMHPTPGTYSFGDFGSDASHGGAGGAGMSSPDISTRELMGPPQPQPSADQLSSAMDQVDAFRPSPPPVLPSAPPILSPFATMRANILITETMLRFVLAEYREWLEDRLAKCTDRPAGHVRSDDWESAAGDMVGTLNSMPLESLAANGQSMIAKLIYLTSSLLSRSLPGSRGSLFLGEFLSTLSRLTSERQEGQAGAGDGDEEEDDDLDEGIDELNVSGGVGGVNADGAAGVDVSMR